MRTSHLSAAETVLREIEKHAEETFLPIVGPEKGAILDEVVKETNPRKVLEIGTLVGYSAIRIGRLLLEDGRIITIERNGGFAEEARRNISKAGLSQKVEVLVGDAKDIIPRLTERLFDLVFIDADKTEYYTYLRLVEKKLRRGSVVIADNAGIFAEQMRDYLRHVRQSGEYTSRYREPAAMSAGGFRDGLEISVKL